MKCIILSIRSTKYIIIKVLQLDMSREFSPTLTTSSNAEIIVVLPSCCVEFLLIPIFVSRPELFDLET